MSVKVVTRCLRRWTLYVALAGSGAVGCRLGPPGPSAVAQGRYFSTGNPDYDEFFVRLHRMQVELAAAPETLAKIRGDLARELEVTPSSASDALRAALTTKAATVAARGATLHVVQGRESGEGLRLAVSGTPAEADRPFVKTLDEAIERLAEVRERSPAWQRELDWLPPAGIALDGGVEAAFVSESRATRDEVRDNLADAQKLVTLMTTRKREIDANGAELEQMFASALGEKRSEPLPPPPQDAEPEKKPKPRPAPRKPSAPPQAAASPARASEATEPAAKPKQGSARPDFEP
jgi:hypothetical protein